MSTPPIGQYVAYTFYRVDPAWRRLPDDERAAGKDAFAEVIERWSERFDHLRAYTTAGIRPDTDLFLWKITERYEELGDLAAELNATREQLAERALLDQRRRIARDVHDLVGHGLAAMLLQVTSARHVLRRDPHAAEAGLRDAEEIGRRAMQDLRGTVGLLRGHDDEVAPAVPSLREIPMLVDHARGGGLAVELRVSGDLSQVGPSVHAALYRIAQETLANAARHAPAARTRLAVEVEGDAVHLHAQTSGPIARATEPERPRYGLVGMRERAATLGGELRAGPTSDGWRVDCRLPLEAA
jgi:signal transduction histidine kinase